MSEYELGYPKTGKNGVSRSRKTKVVTNSNGARIEGIRG